MSKNLSTILRNPSNPGPLAVANGGSGVTTSTGSGSLVLSTSPTLNTPILGTPTSGNLVNCTLPTASTSVLGGVKVDGTSITISNGVISGASTYSLPTASTSVLGGVKVDGTSITISGGIISGASTYSLPIASASVLGGVKVGTGLSIDGAGILSTSGGGGVTLSDDTSTTNTSYLTMSRAVSGTASTIYTSSTKLYFNPSNGTLTATNFNTVSDENQKTNIVPVTGLNIINQLRGVEFDFIESGQHSSGVIAQELEKVLPFLVTESEGTKTVNYSGIIAYLISSINELEQRLKAVEG